MGQEKTSGPGRHSENRFDCAPTDRRTFLTDAGKYGGLLMGSTWLTPTASLESRGVSTQDAAIDAGRDVKEKVDAIRIFAVAQRAPGLTRADIRTRSYISLLGYGTAALQEATKVPDNRQALIFIQNFVNDAAFGEGPNQCPPFIDRDFVAEYLMGVGDTVVGSVQGTVPAPPGAPGQQTPNGQAPRIRVPTLPEYGERGTELRVAARQVVAQGTRPLAITKREKGMHFIKMSPSVPAADQVKIWQALHVKALEANPTFAAGLAGHEVLQRLPDTAARLPNRCGPEIPVSDLIACFWSKTNSAAAQFPNYVRTLRKIDQQGAVDNLATFFVMVEEWEVFINPTFTP